jgi:predicted RNase H-like HicB family nuclease
MTRLPHPLRLAYRLDPEPVNGWVLARCEALDLVSQGRTPEEAGALLGEEARLLLEQAHALGTLATLLERIAAQPAADAAGVLEVDLSQSK